MPRKIKTKYTLRSDGRIVMTKTYKGKRKYFYGKSDKDVEAQFEEYKVNVDAGRTHSIRSFSEVADEWWESKESTLSPNSVCGFKTLKTRAVDTFGDYAVNEITPQMIYTWLKRLEAQDYSQKVIGNSRSVVKQIFDAAFVAGEISVNPCVGLPIVKGKPKQKRKSTPQADLDKIEGSKSEMPFGTMAYFMLFTGCRRGEAAAIQQKHIDREKKAATICQAVAYKDTRQPILKSPKTESGNRVVDLYDNVLAVLPEYEDPETFIFFPKGLPTKTELEAGLKKYQQAHDISSTAHQLRHAYASMGHSAGISAKDMQHRLGHSTIAMTQDIYTDLEEKYNEEVRDKLNSYVQEKFGKK